MSMVIVYTLKNSLYINITNRCTNKCDFCVRNNPSGIKEGVDLWLDREPSQEEVVEEIFKHDLSLYDEIVFCGYGEPMLRTDVIVNVSKVIKERFNLPIRINTNGQANLYYEEDITPKLEGLVDVVSISLNAQDAERYNEVCSSDYGAKAFEGMLDFAKHCKKYVPKVILTVVDVMPKDEIEACRKIADGIGVELKVREMIG